MLRQSLRSLVTSLFPGAAVRSAARPRWRPRLEVLEDRSVPSAGGLSHAHLPLHVPHGHGQAGEERLEHQAERLEDSMERLNGTNNPAEERAERLAQRLEEFSENHGVTGTAPREHGRALGHGPHSNHGRHLGQHKQHHNHGHHNGHDK